VNDIIMETNLGQRKEVIRDFPIKEKEISESDEKQTKSKDDKLESQAETKEIKSEKELEKESEKKIDSKKSQFKRFFGFGKQKNEDKEDIEAEKERITSKSENIEKETKAKRANVVDDLNQSLESSEREDAKNSVEGDFIQTFGDLLDGDEL
jgi:hypothetical protein